MFKTTVPVPGTQGLGVQFDVNSFARLSDGSVLVTCGETIVLVTVNAAPTPREGQDFLPLTVDYQERTGAAGRIPGGYFKREGRPSEREILVSRLMDRPIRPLIVDGFYYDTQIIATVFSADNVNNPDVLAVTGASFALCASHVPWDGPMACVRVGRINGQYKINPTMEETKNSDLDLVVASTEKAIMMVEGGAAELSEAEMTDALMLAFESAQPFIQAQKEMMTALGIQKRQPLPAAITPEILGQVEQKMAARLRDVLALPEKQKRANAFKELMAAVEKECLEAGVVTEEHLGIIDEAGEILKKKYIRLQIVEHGRRLDHRDLTSVRPISSQVGLLPRTHGSSLFTRGETRALVVATLGTGDDEQRFDTLEGEAIKRFMLHYNFPPYSTGETKPLRSPGRREIGHGALAERSVARMLPAHTDFPYTIRVVSDIIESNGSSSMATVCGASLALMDAGVPIKAPVAGIAMGLIEEGKDFYVLTDILGDEDHIGDMDFKVAGTRSGITGLQMDIKISGVSRAILEKALAQARDARLHVLDKMNEAITTPRTDLSRFAPRIRTIQVNPEKLGLIIGPSGKMIRSITEKTQTKIDIEDSGKINIASANGDSLDEAIRMIKGLVEEAEIGKIYKGTVKRIVDFGAFVEILPGKDGLVHVSQLDVARVENVRDFVKEGDIIDVKVIEIDPAGKIRLSRKAVITGEDVPPMDQSGGGRPPRGGFGGGRGGGGEGRRDGRRDQKRF